VVGRRLGKLKGNAKRLHRAPCVAADRRQSTFGPSSRGAVLSSLFLCAASPVRRSAGFFLPFDFGSIVFDMSISPSTLSADLGLGGLLMSGQPKPQTEGA
jgi:hypothetical protein